MSPSIADLVAARRLDRVDPDGVRAHAMLEEAARHLAGAAAITTLDPNGAYHLLYDAARKAVAAHMLANGYRATNAVGAHSAVAEYAREALGGEPSVEHLDRMRRSLNRSEYGTAHFTARVVEADLAHARAIVAAVRAELA